VNDLLAILLTLAVLAVPLALAWLLLGQERPRTGPYSGSRPARGERSTRRASPTANADDRRQA